MNQTSQILEGFELDIFASCYNIVGLEKNMRAMRKDLAERTKKIDKEEKKEQGSQEISKEREKNKLGLLTISERVGVGRHLILNVVWFEIRRTKFQTTFNIKDGSVDL